MDIDPVARATGILGSVTGLIGLGWHWWTYRANRIQRVRAINLRVQDKGKPCPFLSVDIYNCGAIPAYVKSVEIRWAKPIDRHESLPLETDPVAMKVTDGTIFYQPRKNWTCREPIAP